eukprot:1160336-Pelagomonas_calceolata.AAC.10
MHALNGTGENVGALGVNVCSPKQMCMHVLIWAGRCVGWPLFQAAHLSGLKACGERHNCCVGHVRGSCSLVAVPCRQTVCACTHHSLCYRGALSMPAQVTGSASAEAMAAQMTGPAGAQSTHTHNMPPSHACT